MDVQTSIWYEPEKFPGVQFRLKKPTLGTRLDVDRLSMTGNSQESETGRRMRAVWDVYVLEVKGILIDGKEPHTGQVFNDAPEELVVDVLKKLDSMSTPLAETDAMDYAVIGDAQRRIAEAEERIAKRKNSDAVFSSDTSTKNTKTAESA